MIAATLPQNPDTPAGPPETGALSERAILVKLSVTSWNDRATDDNATQQVAEANGVAPGAGRYTKRLLKKEATQEIRQLGQQAREVHNSLSLPWDDKGTRLLPIDAYATYQERIEELTALRQDAVNRFVERYQHHIAEAAEELGELFDPEDYPSAENLRKAVTITLERSMVPDARHFRAELPEDERIRIQEEVTARNAQRINAGLDSLFQQLAKQVALASERLKPNADGEQKTFRDSMITNLQEMVTNIPLLNITGNDRLNEMCKNLQAALDGLTADNLRPHRRDYDPAKQQAFRATVDRMTEQFAGYFG